MPGSPPSSSTEPRTKPPPVTRSSSAMPEGRRGASCASPASGSSAKQPALARRLRPGAGGPLPRLPRRACSTRRRPRTCPASGHRPRRSSGRRRSGGAWTWRIPGSEPNIRVGQEHYKNIDWEHRPSVWMERSEIRVSVEGLSTAPPAWASLHPGYTATLRSRRHLFLHGHSRRPDILSPGAAHRRFTHGIPNRRAASAAFTIDAIVILPDHLHAIWTLPSSDAGFSGRLEADQGAFYSSACHRRRAGRARA